MFPPPAEPLDRPRHVRAVGEDDVPNLRRRRPLPMKWRVAIAVITALGTAAAGIAGSRAGLAGSATGADVAALTARITQVEERVTELMQAHRKDGLNDQQKVDFAKLLEEKVSNQSLARAKRRTPKPKVERP